MSSAPASPPELAPVAHDRPWLYGLLVAPSAVVANGVIQGGALAFLLSQRGIGSAGQSHLIFLLALPTSLYFLWSPITDFFVRRRTWLLVGGLLAALLMCAGFHCDLSTRAASVLLLLSACCVQLVVSSAGGMMGAMRSELSKRSAGSFYQAGSLGFGALAASLLVWSSARTTQAMLGWEAAAMIGIPALFALAAPKQPSIETGSFAATMRRVWAECKTTFFRWEALPYVACMTFPMASGSAIGLLTGVAKQYGEGGDQVAWINGLLGGLLMAAGSGVMALVKSRMRAPVLYMIVALVNCASMCILWLGPLRPATYLAGVLTYLFTIGACYAMFTAVVLEFLGDSGKSGSGRYSIINSLGNVPVLYMVVVDGWAGEKWGARGIGASEAVLGAIAACLILGYFLTFGKRRDADAMRTGVAA